MADICNVEIHDGRREMWFPDILPGGWICAEPDPADFVTGICGMPVEDMPCTIHHPGLADR